MSDILERMDVDAERTWTVLPEPWKLAFTEAWSSILDRVRNEGGQIEDAVGAVWSRLPNGSG